MLKQISLFRLLRPVHWRVLATLLLYAAYLPFSGYLPSQFRFDAAEYWELSLKFTSAGHFSLLAFDDPMRGYLGPLLVLPARLVCHYTGWTILTGARLLGMGWAALLFGVAIPGLWARTTDQPVQWGRWLALLGLTFACWRDYFNFTLSDMPALTLLLLALGVGWRPGWRGAFVVGLLLAAAINLRPIYLASVPACIWLALGMSASSGKLWTRLAALVVGAAVVLLPQLLLNRLHFGHSTPLVLARRPGIEQRSLYLEKLNWGLEQQKYETCLAIDYPVPMLIFRDEAGVGLLREARTRFFHSYRTYAAAVFRHPLITSGVYARHLFNGLDIQYPTPYIRQVYRPTWGLAWLNYSLWFGAVLVLGGWRWRLGKLKHWLVLAALLLPCGAMVPVGMECRYLLPLHLLLISICCLGWPTAWNRAYFRRWPWHQQLLLAGSYAGFVALCFGASAAAQATLEYGSRVLF